MLGTPAQIFVIALTAPPRIAPTTGAPLDASNRDRYRFRSSMSSNAAGVHQRE